MSTSDFGLVTSIFAFGGLGGALLGAPLSNRYGRRGSLLLCSLGFALGGLVMAFAGSLGGMLAGRMISGIASGAAMVVVPLYVHELAPEGEKGSFGAITQISVNLGILLTQSLGLFLSKEALWRLILGVGAVLGAIQGLLLLRAHESPKWLAANRRQGDAEDSLHALRGRNLSMAEIEQALSDHQGETSEVIAVIGIMLLQQLTGINAIVMYGVSVLRELIPENDATLINVFISAINLFFTWYASRFFDSAGRKPYLLASIGGMGLNSLALGLGIIFHIPLLSATATILFVSSFKTVEFSASGAAQSISLCASWIGTFLVSYGFPVLAATGLGKGGVFLVFAGVALLGAVFVQRCIPETNGKSVNWWWWGGRWPQGTAPWLAFALRRHASINKRGGSLGDWG
ncbi:general substrate transporter [Terfezia claveryi]|nr:general substrate transporter [Terfezia claveryi]